MFSIIGLTKSIIGTQVSDTTTKTFIIYGYAGISSVSVPPSPKPRNIVIIDVITEAGLAFYISSKLVSHLTIIKRSIKPNIANNKII